MPSVLPEPASLIGNVLLLPLVRHCLLVCRRRGRPSVRHPHPLPKAALLGPPYTFHVRRCSDKSRRRAACNVGALPGKLHISTSGSYGGHPWQQPELM